MISVKKETFLVRWNQEKKFTLRRNEIKNTNNSKRKI